MPDAVEVLSEAFHEYPVMRYVLGPVAGYEGRLRTLIGFFVSARVYREDPILGIHDNSGSLAAVALVTLPVSVPEPKALTERRETVWQELGAAERARYEAFGAACAEFAITAPHHHLNMIGVRSAQRGSGFGRALLQAVHDLAASDEQSCGVTLTTETESNLGLYQRFGYRLLGHSRVAPELETWAFLREKKEAVTGLLLTLTLIMSGCGPESDRKASPKSQAESVVAQVPQAAKGSLSRIGLAVSDSARRWCAEFLVDSAAAALAPGSAITIVFPGAKPINNIPARLVGPQPQQCPAAFPQPRWIDYRAYRLELSDSLSNGVEGITTVGLAVASVAAWRPDERGRLYADLDGDGKAEEARRCTADEGEHFTIWSSVPAGGRERRWHEYYNWGGLTEPTCGPGEDGQGPSITG